MECLVRAQEALNNLSKSAITELRAYKRPTRRVEKVCEAVCILFGKEPQWSEMKKLMSGDGKFD
jgi:hypothetical protein